MSSPSPRTSHHPSHRTARTAVLATLALLTAAAAVAQTPQQTQQAQQAQAQQAARQAQIQAQMQAQQAARQTQMQAQQQALQSRQNQNQMQGQQTGRQAQMDTQQAARQTQMQAQQAARQTQMQAQQAARQTQMQAQQSARQTQAQTQQATRQAQMQAQQTPRQTQMQAQQAGRQAQGSAGSSPAATRSLPNTGAQAQKTANAPNQRPVASGPPVMSRNFPGHPAPPGSTETQTHNGSIVRTAPDGSVIDVRSPRNGVSIHHGLDGSRRIMVEQPDRSRVYIPSRGIQYVQHPYNFHGHSMDHRTFVVNGQLTHQFYRPYNYGGTTLDVYATSRYYAPNVYQWAGTRFKAPTNFSWTYTTAATPWYNHYRGFFTPESSYETPLAWLTDYMLGSTLSVAYTTKGQAADPLPANAAPVTPQVKQLLADEVGRQVKQEADEAADNAKNREPQPEAASVVHELADRQPHVFVVSSDLDLVDPSGRRCSMSEGDVVQVTSGPKSDSGTVDAVVLATKGGEECGRAAQVQLALNDVQEMQNHMRETIDQGIANTKAGKEGQSVTPAFAAAAPPADANAAGEIQQQQAIAAAAEG